MEAKRKGAKKPRALKACMRFLVFSATIFILVVAAMYFSSRLSVSKPGLAPSAQDYLVLVNWKNPIANTPEDLIRLSEVMSDEIVVLGDDDLKLNRTAGVAANKMFEAAKTEGFGGYIINSAYRSVETQTVIWQNRMSQDPSYGSDPYNRPVKAMPGDRSEHSTGLALDILCETHNSADDAFGNTVEAKWLAEHAHRFGFILRYPKDKETITGVIYEPWHFRYVGIEAATEIYEQGLCLEEYLKN